MTSQEANRGVNAPSLDPAQVDDLCIRTVRFLSVDAVEIFVFTHDSIALGEGGRYDQDRCALLRHWSGVFPGRTGKEHHGTPGKRA